jgi:hypothetical protein
MLPFLSSNIYIFTWEQYEIQKPTFISQFQVLTFEIGRDFSGNFRLKVASAEQESYLLLHKTKPYSMDDMPCLISNSVPF